MRANNIFFEDDGMRRMERFLDMSVQRQSLISSNLANVDTPGYATVDVDFERELEGAAERQELLSVTNSRHIPLHSPDNSPAAAVDVQGLTIRNDLNNVNIDREMAQLSTNALQFSMVAQLLGGRFRGLKNAILEGR